MRRRILVLYWYPRGEVMREAVSTHLHALDGRGDEIVYHNAADPPGRGLRWLDPDAVVLHTTFLGLRWDERFAWYRRRYAWVSGLSCPKLALPQDEYDHSDVLEAWLGELGATRVFSVFGPEQRALLYPHLHAQLDFRQALTGYVDEAAARLAEADVPRADRPFDLVYRAAQLPYWFGSHGQLKHRIAEAVVDCARPLGLSIDVSTRWEDRILGSDWLRFVASGRAIVGCESGSSVLDRTGELQRRIRALLAANPRVTFEEVDALMPPGWDAHTFFALSPRHLEAVATRTCQVLVEGSYSGVLRPGRHYVPVRRDLSDLNEALVRALGPDAEAMTDRAYEELIETRAVSLDRFADQLLEAVGPRRARASRAPSSAARGAASALDSAEQFAVGVAARTQPVRAFAAAASFHGRAWLRPLGELARSPGLAALVARATARRQPPSPRLLAGDLLRLSILRRIQSLSRAGGPWWISATVEDGTLLLRTEVDGASPCRRQAVMPDDAWTAMVWDHAAVGTTAPLDPATPGRGPIAIGMDGRYTFIALALLAREAPTDVTRLIEHALTGGDEP